MSSDDIPNTDMEHGVYRSALVETIVDEITPSACSGKMNAIEHIDAMNINIQKIQADVTAMDMKLTKLTNDSIGNSDTEHAAGDLIDTTQILRERLTKLKSNETEENSSLNSTDYAPTHGELLKVPSSISWIEEIPILHDKLNKFIDEHTKSISKIESKMTNMTSGNPVVMERAKPPLLVNPSAAGLNLGIARNEEKNLKLTKPAGIQLSWKELKNQQRIHQVAGPKLDSTESVAKPPQFTKPAGIRPPWKELNYHL